MSQELAFTIPYGFVGVWTPPANVGVLESQLPYVKNGGISIPASLWTNESSQGPAYPQFSTNLGQQIGKVFLTYGTPVGAVGENFQGYLGDNYNQQNKFDTPGPMFFEPNVTAVDGWEPIVGQPVVVASAPVAGTSNQQIAQEIIALAGKIVN